MKDDSVCGMQAVGTQDGSVVMYQLAFSTIHGIFRDRYAYREHLTNINVVQLTSNRKSLFHLSEDSVLDVSK